MIYTAGELGLFFLILLVPCVAIVCAAIAAWGLYFWNNRGKK